jgi:hypothetical protein
MKGVPEVSGVCHKLPSEVIDVSCQPKPEVSERSTRRVDTMPKQIRMIRMTMMVMMMMMMMVGRN